MNLINSNTFANRYTLIKKLGVGGFSEVWLAEDTKSGNMQVALKIFAPGSGLDADGLKVFSNEYSLVFNLNHPSLLKPMHYDEFSDRPFLVMQYHAKGNCVKQCGSFTEKQLAEFTVQIAESLNYLHSLEPPIVHQDIKPANVLISDADKYLQDRDPIKANDIFSFGVTLFELLTDALPYGEQGGVIAASGLEPADLPDKYSKNIALLINACLQKETYKRPNAQELIQAAQN